MAITQADIDALNTAIAQGERLVRFSDGRTVEYRSIPELITARNDLESRLIRDSAAATGTARPRQTYLYHGGRDY